MHVDHERDRAGEVTAAATDSKDPGGGPGGGGHPPGPGEVLEVVNVQNARAEGWS
jgi:hypothetical protein